MSAMSNASQVPRLAGRTILITGAGRGIGAGLARGLAKNGAAVAAADVDFPAAKIVVDEIVASGAKAHAIDLDVTDRVSCEAAAETCRDRLGGLDTLICNAGVLLTGTASTLGDGDFERVQSVNVTGTFLTVRAMLPLLVKAGRSNIVIMSSIAGLRGGRMNVAYSTSKHALIGMMRCLAIDHADQGVRVNAICPAVIESDMTKKLFERQTVYKTYEDYVAFRASQHLLKRVGKIDDMLKVTMHLIGDEADWITGTSYVVDGGCMLVT
jgi:NAD(P)-dependent dehydrogenase (short-subunit alcohol dehydrogenase family)